MFDPHHLSFSGTLQRGDGKVMIVRRTPSSNARSVWEHSFHGSPRPAETLIAAVRRCVERDLGILATTIESLLPTLDNRVVSVGHVTPADKTIEAHPSYVVTSDTHPIVLPGIEILWMHPAELGDRARGNPHQFSPLLVAHAARLPFFGGNPLTDHPAIPLKERVLG